MTKLDNHKNYTANKPGIYFITGDRVDGSSDFRHGACAMCGQTGFDAYPVVGLKDHEVVIEIDVCEDCYFYVEYSDESLTIMNEEFWNE